MGNISNLRVTKANDLVEAQYRLSVNEQRIVLMAIARIDSRKPLREGDSFTIFAHEYAEFYNKDLKNTYVELREAVDKLYERDVKVVDDKKKGRFKSFRWLSGREYRTGEGSITMHFTKQIIPYLSKIHKQFTSYEIKHIAGLVNMYSIRVYEFCKQYEKFGYREISVEEFKEMLQITGSYARFSNLKSRVLNPVAKEISQCTDIKVSYTPIKRGRNITKIRFEFEAHKQQTMAV